MLTLLRSRSGQFETVDAELLFCMVRVFKPKLMIEVGSGFSTRVALEVRTACMPFLDPH